MKKFNEVISIEVAVDTIAASLLSSMKDDFKHRELVTESIVGRMLVEDKSALSRLYNSLNGHITEIDFKVGDNVHPEHITAYGYWGEPKEDGTRERSSRTINDAIVSAVNPFANNALTLTFNVPQRDGSMEIRTETVHHTSCKKMIIDAKEV